MASYAADGALGLPMDLSTLHTCQAKLCVHTSTIEERAFVHARGGQQFCAVSALILHFARNLI